MKLLENASYSITMGVEDFDAGTDARLLSAVRNLYAGTLLLFKEKLRRMSPPNSHDVLMKLQAEPVLYRGRIIFRGVGEKTVGVPEIQKRFQSLRIDIDWSLMKSFSDLRNRIEHHTATISRAAVARTIELTLTIVRDFVRKHLSEDPLTLLGEHTWARMLSIADVELQEREECSIKMREVQWDEDGIASSMFNDGCLNCGSMLIAPVSLPASYLDVTIRCRSCGTEIKPRDYEDDYLHGLDKIEDMTALFYEADMPVLTVCPRCGEKSFISRERKCTLCGYL